MKKTLINQIKTEMSGVLNNAQRQKLKEVLVLLLYFYWRFIKLKVFFSVQFAIEQLPQRSCCIKYFLLPVVGSFAPLFHFVPQLRGLPALTQGKVMQVKLFHNSHPKMCYNKKV